MRRRKNSGFTIIELLVVIGIIGTLLAIAGISGKTWLDKSRVEGQMNQMYVDLMNARVSAMQRGRMHFVTLAATQYTIYEDTNPGPDGDGDLQTDDRQVMQKDLNPLYSLTIPAAASEIYFDSRGLAWAVPPALLGAGQKIHVTNSYGSAYDCIFIGPTRISMGAWNGTDCNLQ